MAGVNARTSNRGSLDYTHFGARGPWTCNVTELISSNLSLAYKLDPRSRPVARRWRASLRVVTMIERLSERETATLRPSSLGK